MPTSETTNSGIRRSDWLPPSRLALANDSCFFIHSPPADPTIPSDFFLNTHTFLHLFLSFYNQLGFDDLFRPSPIDMLNSLFFLSSLPGQLETSDPRFFSRVPKLLAPLGSMVRPHSWAPS